MISYLNDLLLNCFCYFFFSFFRTNYFLFNNCAL